MLRFEIYKDAAGEFRFRLVARNGEIIAASEAYKNERDCLATAKLIRDYARDAVIKHAGEGRS